MVGLIQQFRPDPGPLEPVFSETEECREVYSRLQSVFRAAGNPRRSNGMKDAFFIVRDPEPVTEEVLQNAGADFLDQLSALANEQSSFELASKLG